ncbi:ribonuclease HIII [[Mycoplasma] testudinis]|uniref:ribonuclease HIII n=1 Tax=[Mycoplasma] testudinis TaxID=33924 RepID=UPI00048243CC|nr:ribonuclease HIII [[Mycoplasma] testudinis]
MHSKTFTKRINQKQLLQIKERFTDFRISSTNPNIFFAFKYDGVTVSLYHSGTILFQGNNSEAVVKLVLNEAIPRVENKENEVKHFNIVKPKHQNIQLGLFAARPNEIGCDEVGVGDYFGGITTCACFINEEQKKLLVNFGIQDSKNLTDDKIIKLANQMKSDLNIKYAICNYDAKSYNDLYAKYKNGNVLKTLAHNEALNNLLTDKTIKLVDTNIIMDQYVNQKLYNKYLKDNLILDPVEINIFETKAESKYISVAAASILARDAWLTQTRKIQTKFKIPLFLGSSNPNVLIVAKELYAKYGINGLNQAVKIHFSFTEKIIKSRKLSV